MNRYFIAQIHVYTYLHRKEWRKYNRNVNFYFEVLVSCNTVINVMALTLHTINSNETNWHHDVTSLYIMYGYNLQKWKISTKDFNFWFCLKTENSTFWCRSCSVVASPLDTFDHLLLRDVVDHIWNTFQINSLSTNK